MNKPVSAVAGAVTGALLALPFVSPPGLTLSLVAVAGVVAGAAIAAWLVDPLVRPRPDAPPPPEDRTQWQAPVPVRAGETVRAVLPVSEPTGQWWAKAAPTRPSPAAAPPRRTAPDLASYADGARVVQCPACGEFRVDVTHVPGGFTFRCRADDHHWEWQAGTPWPAAVNVSRPRRTAF